MYNGKKNRKGRLSGMDEKHRKKMVAPILITAFFVIYLIAYVFFLVQAVGFNLWMILSAIPLFALGGGMIYTLRERIEEIRSGEEDDLSNY